jgi:hypothetical protein
MDIAEIKKEVEVPVGGFKKYEVIINCKAKAVLFAENEADAIEKSKQNKIEKTLIYGETVSINEVKDGSENTKQVIKNIVGSMQAKMKDLKYCTSCEKNKPKDGFKKNTWGDTVCQDCLNN